MFVLPSAGKPRPLPRAPKSIGAVRTAQWALLSKATTPSWSVGASASAARRIASLAMSTFSKPRVPDGLALSRRVAGAVAVSHAARLVDDGHHRHVRRALAVADGHVHRQRLLQRRVEVAAGPVAVPPAEHDEALAEVTDVGLDRGHRRRAQRGRRHVVEDEAVVAGEAGQRRRHPARRHDRHLEVAVGERGDEVGGTLGVVGGDEHLGRPGDEHVGVGRVVLAEPIRLRLDDGAEDVEAGRVGGDAERDGGDARFELQLARRHRGAVREQAQGRAGRDRRAQPDHEVDRLADPRAGRRIERVDEHLGRRLVGGGDDVEPDATRGRGGDRVLRLPGGVVAVREQHDPLLRAGREDRGGQADRGADVGRARDRRRCGLRELVELRRQAVDERVATEDDDAGGVTLGHLAHRGACPVDELLARGVEHRGRCVEQEDDAEPIRRQRQAHPGQREDEARRQRHPNDERRDPPPGRKRPRGGHPADGDDRPDRNRQPQPDRVREVDGEAHRARPPSGCGRRPNARNRVRRVGRW